MLAAPVRLTVVTSTVSVTVVVAAAGLIVSCSKLPPVALLIVALTGVWLFLWTGREGAINAPATSAPMSVELLQGNIPQDEKFEQGSGIPLALNWYAQALHNAKAQLVVAPETAIPLLPQQLPEGYMELVSGPFVRAGGQQAALVGVPLGSFEQGYTNSVLGWMPGASTGVKTGVSTQAAQTNFKPLGSMAGKGFFLGHLFCAANNY